MHLICDFAPLSLHTSVPTPSPKRTYLVDCFSCKVQMKNTNSFSISSALLTQHCALRKAGLWPIYTFIMCVCLRPSGHRISHAQYNHRRPKFFFYPLQEGRRGNSNGELLCHAQQKYFQQTQKKWGGGKS